MIIRQTRENDVIDIAKLLANRHKRERLVFPILNDIFESYEHLVPIITSKLESKFSISICAYEGEELVGFMISNIKDENLFGRSAWIKYDGMAIAENADVETYRKMYAYIANIWIEYGCLSHYIIVAAGYDSVLNSILMSGFSYQQVYGMKELYLEDVMLVDGIDIRESTTSDRIDLVSLSNLILSHQAKSPTFAAALPEMTSDIRKGYSGLVDDKDALVLLAYKNNQLLGFQCKYFDGDDKSNMMKPSKAAELAIGGVIEPAREKGITKAMASMLNNKAIEKGYKYSITDWRITNLSSSIVWPKLGYKPYAYRMVRTIDKRVFWADGKKTLE